MRSAFDKLISWTGLAVPPSCSLAGGLAHLGERVHR